MNYGEEARNNLWGKVVLCSILQCRKLYQEPLTRSQEIAKENDELEETIAEVMERVEKILDGCTPNAKKQKPSDGSSDDDSCDSSDEG